MFDLVHFLVHSSKVTRTSRLVSVARGQNGHIQLMQWHHNNFRERFGLHYVDFNDPERPRTPKASSKFIKNLAKNNGFVHP